MSCSKCGDPKCTAEHPMSYVWTQMACLHRQLASAQAKLIEAAKLAFDTAQLADGLARDIVIANDRVASLEEEKAELRAAWKTWNQPDDSNWRDGGEIFDRILTPPTGDMWDRVTDKMKEWDKETQDVLSKEEGSDG